MKKAQKMAQADLVAKHAVRKATSLLEDFEGAVLICFADTPFITPKTIKKILKSLKKFEGKINFIII